MNTEYRRWSGVLTAILLAAAVSAPIGCRPGLIQRASAGVILEGKPVGGWFRFQVVREVKRQARLKDRSARDARIDDSTWEVVPERTGIRVEVDETVDRVMNAKPGEEVRLVRQEFRPRLVRDALAPRIREISRYSTSLAERGPEQIHNIKLTAKAIDRRILRPSEEFSFNGVVGIPTRELGYKDAPVFNDDGTVKMEPGGGMCQVSTTLYNAVLLAGLPVVERHPHSKPVSYVPKGRDATVYDDKDFRFRNGRKNPIMLRSSVVKGRIIIRILERTG